MNRGAHSASVVQSDREETARRKYAESKRLMGQRHTMQLPGVTEEVTALLLPGVR